MRRQRFTEEQIIGILKVAEEYVSTIYVKKTTRPPSQTAADRAPEPAAPKAAPAKPAPAGPAPTPPPAEK